MSLFIVSFILVFLSSFFITSILEPRKSILGFIYLFLIAFAQIILTFEILSLFTAIQEFWILTANVTFFALSTTLWLKKGSPLWSLDFKSFWTRFKNSLKLDKSLIWLFVGFCIFIIINLILCLTMPITSADGRSYHVARCLFWISQKSLNHFDVADIRCLCLPINSEILYSWVILFIKKDVLLGFFSFVGYLISIISAYNIIGLLGYCTRKKLWVVFILSSLPCVIVQASGTETDIVIAGLISSCFFLFWYALKNNKKAPLYMASLAYAIAIGTKTTSILMLPSIILFMIFLCFYYKKYKHFLSFLILTLINFLIFSSYNYILNYIQFSNFMSPQSFMVVSKNYYGFKGAISNFIKYIFMMIDFTGFKWGDYLTPQMTNLRTYILTSMHLIYIKDGLYSIPYYFANRLLLEPIIGAGILGFLIYIPCLVWALLKSLLTRFKYKKVLFLSIFAIMFIINILSISYFLAYMLFSVRFVMAFMVLSSPILIYSYLSNKNPIKYVIILFALFYLICVSSHLWARPFCKLVEMYKEHPSITYIREAAGCKDYKPNYTDASCQLAEEIKNHYSTNMKILAFASSSSNIFAIKRLEFEGYKIDFKRLEEINKIKINDYNLIVLPIIGQNATIITDYEKRKGEYKLVGNKILIKKDNLVPCIYKKNKNILYSKEADYPYSTYCNINPLYFKKRNSKLQQIVGQKRFSAYTGDAFIIYKNNTPVN